MVTAKKARKTEEKLLLLIAQDEAYMSQFRHEWTPSAWPEYNPATWPSRFHNKCDIEWCGYANPPSTVPGDHRCGYRECVGNFHVTPEMAAAVAFNNELAQRREQTKKYRIKYIDPLPLEDGTLLRSSGKSAMEARWRPRAPSIASVATAPALVRFPQQQDPPMAPNPLHPGATSFRRVHKPRPSLPARVRPVHDSHHLPNVFPSANYNRWVSAYIVLHPDR